MASNKQPQTKENIRHILKDIGFETDRINRAVTVYENNYPIYDVSIIREILYRMTIKDKLTLWQKSNKTIFHSRIQIKKALKTFDVHDYYIEGAIKKYEKAQDWNSDTAMSINTDASMYDLEEIIEIVLECARVKPHTNNTQNTLTIAVTPITPIQRSHRSQSHSRVSLEGGTHDTDDTVDSHVEVAVIGQAQNKEIKRIKKSPNPKQKRINKGKKPKNGSQKRMGNVRNMKAKNINASAAQLCNIESEIITTEKNYFDGLSLLLNELILPMFAKQLLDRKYYYKIVSSLPALIEFHCAFLTELNTAHNIQNGRRRKTLSNVFNKYVLTHQKEFIEIYVQFICDYNEILDIFGTKNYGNKLLNAFLKQKRSDQKQSLFNYLILPIQRIPRYILLLKDLKKYTNPQCGDFVSIENAILIITKIANYINSEQSKIENMRKCLDIQQSLSGLKHPIVDQSNLRKFEGNFTFLAKERGNRERIFYVFTDIVIIANHKKKVKYVLDIRTIDIKMDTSVLHRHCEDSHYNSDSGHCEEKSNHEYIDFTLITGITKPIGFVSHSLESVKEIQDLIEVNRYCVWSQELQQSHSSSTKRSKSSASDLNNHLARQLALVM